MNKMIGSNQTPKDGVWKINNLPYKRVDYRQFTVLLFVGVWTVLLESAHELHEPQPIVASFEVIVFFSMLFFLF